MAVALAYLGLAALGIYWVAEQQLFYGNDVATVPSLTLLAVTHFAAGLLVGRWWAIALPVLIVFLALPAGYPDANRGEPLPIWLGIGFLWLPIGIPAVATGVLGAMWLRWRRFRSS